MSTQENNEKEITHNFIPTLQNAILGELNFNQESNNLKKEINSVEIKNELKENKDIEK